MLKTILKQYRKTALFYVINGVIAILSGALSVVFFQRLIDLLPHIRSYNQILNTLIVYGLTLLINCILQYVDEYPLNILSNGIYQSIKLAAIKKVSTIDYLSYQELGTGSLLQTIENGAEAGKNILFGFYLTIFNNLLPQVVISLIFIGIYNSNIMLAIAIGYIFIFLISNILLKHLYAVKNNILSHQELLSKYSVRSLMEMTVFRLNKRFTKEIDSLERTSKTIVKEQTIIKMVHELFFTLFALIVIVIKLVIVIFGIDQVIKGKATVGSIVALITFTDNVYNPIAIFNVIFIDYKLDKVTFNRFLKFIKMPDDANLDTGENCKIEKGTIDFKNVSFKYENITILNNLMLSIKGGQSTAIVGSSGGGKSTIIKLILGLLKPSVGEVLVDGKNLSKIRLNDYYDYVSYISQDAPIFDGTLRENIVFDQKISDEKIYEILEKVMLKDLALKIPDKLDTRIGEKGTKLSGGEKQRLALARVFFQKSKLVILDEPTSAMDVLTEKVVMDNLFSMLRDRTLIIVVHRLQTIQNADNIIVLEKGNLAEQGNFETLINKKGLFNMLWESQSKE